MKTILKIQKSVRGLLNNEQPIDKMIEDIHFLYVRWYHSDRDKHLYVLSTVEYIRNLLINLQNNKIDLAEINKEIETCWFSTHLLEGIDDYLNCLHDLMICWSYDIDTYSNDNTHRSIHESYKVLRDFLKDLKSIEFEIMNEFYSKVC